MYVTFYQILDTKSTLNYFRLSGYWNSTLKGEFQGKIEASCWQSKPRTQLKGLTCQATSSFLSSSSGSFYIYCALFSLLLLSFILFCHFHLIFILSLSLRASNHNKSFLLSLSFWKLQSRGPTAQYLLAFHWNIAVEYFLYALRWIAGPTVPH